jgi:CRP-like cAMP-binding protein
MSLIDLLKTVSLFNGLSDRQLQRLIDISAEEIVDDEDIIIKQGAEGDKLYFISDGQVEVLVRRRPNEPEHSQVYLGRGQIFGEMALIDMGKRSATVRCSQDHTVLRVIDSGRFPSAARIRPLAILSCEIWRLIYRSSCAIEISILGLTAYNSFPGE